ncbi:VOC family protein [Halopseudomonas sp. SMJS2]|uniref:VOC family protein n=1 Tax=Halopseudomonas sp. SMJS2 TaxID=3041098 RepID=UPI0024536DFB|nr:VOC family protein [Halopseudomonas sp. SMJS2]WGK62028.1 VOC family protein [Halopseudomonas sp. SMJS2]
MHQPNPCRWLTALLLPLLLTACLGGGGSDNDASPTHPAEPPPPTSTATYLEAIGIGVSDLDAAVDFYRNGLGMREVQRLTRDDRIEVVMESADRRGSHILLMEFTDGVGRNYQQNPGKLVFYAHDATAFASRFESAGGRITAPPAALPEYDGTLVGFGRDPDNNLIEIVGVPSVTDSFLAAVGIGVSDLQQALALYTDAISFQEQAFLQVPGLYDEYTLLSPVPGGSALVLMHWTNGSDPNYQDNPVKLQLATADPRLLADRLAEADADILHEPAASTEPDLNQALVGYATDHDGTLIEIRQSLRSYLGAAAIGVEDLQAAEDFFSNGLGMRVVARRTRENREETVMESADATGSNLVLMAFTDGVPRNLRQNPGKLVFYTRDMESYVASFQAAGGRITLPPTRDPALGVTVGFGRDLHNNLIELVADPAAEHSYFGAFGIGVSDLEAARAFYVDELGFRQLLYLPIPGMYNEYILQGYGGSALVLMNWTNGGAHNYRDNPVKMEIRSIAPVAFAEAVERAGGELLQAPDVTDDPGLEGEIVGIAKDLDGSLMEIQQARWGME